jgi:ankyrin repeat protein
VANNVGDTPLTVAVANGDVTCVNIMLEAACHVNHPNRAGESALGKKS